MQRITIKNLQIAEQLYRFVNEEVLPETQTEQGAFWGGFAALVDKLVPENRQLLNKRDDLQQQIDDWHLQQGDIGFDFPTYKQFLFDIGYLIPEIADFEVSPQRVDAEIATLAGPQLVVPINNARYALNAANARWGSLYDALYGTDAISREEFPAGKEFSRERAREVIRRTMSYLDQLVPLQQGSYEEVSRFELLTAEGQPATLQLLLVSGSVTTLSDADQFCGFNLNEDGTMRSVLLRNNGLHIEIALAAEGVIAALHPAGIEDVLLESALTTIQDCEDSVTAVDCEDKLQVYRNWLGLMKGDLVDRFSKNGQTVARELNPDRPYQGVSGGTLTLPGRSLMLVRNVGHLMTNDAILLADGSEIPEGILDGVITSLIAKHDLLGNGRYRNSREGSVYIVKPKMHGPEEVAFTVKLFGEIEALLGLEANTLKVGIMDEERRTSLNLKACIYEARERVVFINTGFLDRTGDEMHTSMQAGPMVRKEAMRGEAWIQAYEVQNVQVGLACGLHGKAQIGKGMWAKPDCMAEMMSVKGSQLKAGASCAWVPSPTAATLHVLDYHQFNVAQRQQQLLTADRVDYLDDLLHLPLLVDPEVLTAEEIEAELENNAQGILGYVVRWVEQGVGCSKVPDIHDVGLMEDRATLRISSQHIANWLSHGLCDEAQVMAVFKRMAERVDAQNSGDPSYKPMAPDFSGHAFLAALSLVFEGAEQPSGYTEPLLHKSRALFKKGASASLISSLWSEGKTVSA